ncbi:hypothetical protein H310_09108 [Aphanomyces invadans]|uniref:Potassium channel domain-containing protein n=1 Tax=Aphanomyces invadans TaxID=157072 RepID=A0A024TWK4_9STRA|nr:hypothetical protein H310_09108 [Aphanomyces invadans]ETV97742.1 hypothetical protein H310_09108 [Aphanomyces invadans]|eukprot:XP_008873303.1 hypothetical protein H310_09108 [Aphanomyces invadans]
MPAVAPKTTYTELSSSDGSLRSREEVSPNASGLRPPYLSSASGGPSAGELNISSPDVVVSAGHSKRTSKHQRSTGDRDMLYVPTCRDTLRKHVNSWIGVYLEVLNTALSVVCCAFYLIELYCPTLYADLHFRLIEVGATVFFALHYVLHLFSEDDVGAFVLSFNGIIDLTIAPSLIMYFIDDPSSRALTLFRVFRVFRALRVLRLHNLIRSRKHGYNYEWGVFVFSLSAIIFVAAGIFHALEDYPERDRQLQFHNSLYYILVTLSTIGYGDIVPTRTLTEFFVMGLIIVVVTTVPAQISRLHDLHVSMKAYDGAYTSRPGRGHVIVCGHVVHDSFADFLAEFYHPSRGVINFDVVVLSPDPPSSAMTRMLSNVVYANKTTFLKGSLVHDVDRKRTMLECAEAVFVLADKDARATEAQDASTLLQALSIRNYADSTGCNIRMYLQMLSDVHHELSHIIGANQIIHANQVKADLVCRGVVCPGSCTLILNLMQSVDQVKMKKHVAHPTPWMHEYIGGMSQQVFAVLFSAGFDGHLYDDVARRFFTGFDVVLFAVYRREKDEDTPRVTLSPFGKTMRPGDIGFILSTSASVVHAIQSEYSAVVEGEMSAPSPRHSSQRSIPVVSKSNLLQRKFVRKVTLAPTIHPSSTPPATGTMDSDPKTVLEAQLSDATRKDMMDMQDHVVVCGATRHILPLVDVLRAMYASTTHLAEPASPPPLVLLVNHIPTANDFGHDYVLPPDVYFVRGVSTQCPDLSRVSIQRAKAVLLFPLERSHQPATIDDAYLLDYGVVTSLLCLETTCDNAKAQQTSNGRSAATVARDEVAFYANRNVPLQDVQNRMLEHFPTLNPDVFRAPSIENMSRRLSACPGEASTSSSVAVASTFFSDLKSMAVLQRGSNIKFCRPRDVLFSCDSLPYLSPAFAAGRVFVDSRLDLVLCQAFYNPYITELLHLLTGNPLNPDALAHGPILTQIDIPVEFVSGRYGDLVLAMMRLGKIALGLYRYPNIRLGNTVPYVLTAPPSDTVVFHHDRLFVIENHHHSG